MFLNEPEFQPQMFNQSEKKQQNLIIKKVS